MRELPIFHPCRTRWLSALGGFFAPSPGGPRRGKEEGVRLWVQAAGIFNNSINTLYIYIICIYTLIFVIILFVVS